MIFPLTITLGVLSQVYITRADPAPDKPPVPVLGEACLEHCGCPVDFESIEAFLLCAQRVHAVTSLTLPAEALGKPATSSSSSSSSLWVLGDCYRGGPCDCDDIEDKKSEKYLQCMANEGCEHCHIKEQTKTTNTSPTSSILSPTITPPSTTTTATASVPQLPDNCYIGGPCDCGAIVDKSSTAYFQCVTNPTCEHCFINGTSLSTRSTSIPSPTTSTAIATKE